MYSGGNERRLSVTVNESKKSSLMFRRRDDVPVSLIWGEQPQVCFHEIIVVQAVKQKGNKNPYFMFTTRTI